MKLIIVLILSAASVLSLDNGIGLTPPLGFNSWRSLKCNVNDKAIRKLVDDIVKLKLISYGYNILNIHDCWAAPKRENRRLVVNKTYFPDGMKSVVDYVHTQKLLFGLGASAGRTTKMRYPGSEGYEKDDADTWKDWDVDFITYEDYDSSVTNVTIRYEVMRDALNATKKPIYYALANNGRNKTWEWGKPVANSWRISSDTWGYFDVMRENYFNSVYLYDYAGPGGWNDLGLLQVGTRGLSLREQKTQFSLWAMAKSPLIIAADIRSISKQSMAILTNKDIIELSQDKLGKPSLCAMNCDKEYFSENAKKPQFGVMQLSDKNYVISITNWNDERLFAHIKVNFADLKLNGNKYQVRELWTKKDMGEKTDEFSVVVLASHDTLVFKLTKC